MTKLDVCVKCCDQCFGGAALGHVCTGDPLATPEEREQFATGAVRAKLDNARYDLIPVGPLRRLAMTYAEGARKYSDHNWRKGIPYSNVLNHLYNHLALWRDGGDDSEDHLAHAVWGLFALMWFEHSGLEGLDDLP